MEDIDSPDTTYTVSNSAGYELLDGLKKFDTEVEYDKQVQDEVNRISTRVLKCEKFSKTYDCSLLSKTLIIVIGINKICVLEFTILSGSAYIEKWIHVKAIFTKRALLARVFIISTHNVRRCKQTPSLKKLCQILLGKVGKKINNCLF